MNEVSLIEEKMSKRVDEQETASASIKEEEDAAKPEVIHALENYSSDSEVAHNTYLQILRRGFF